jgi:methane monooxygenase component A beta chain/propane monooxygenase small subunit
VTAPHQSEHATEPQSDDGYRTFVWFTPERRKPSEYEMYTVGQQSGPDGWLDVDWPLRFDNGRAPWDDSSSSVVSTRWSEFRDPGRQWQRPYISDANHDEQALARLLPVLTTGSSGGVHPVWAKEILGRTYAAWPFVEYGLFLGLAYAVREARSDTVEFAIVFQSADRMRVLQDIVLHLDFLADEIPGFSDATAREAWMNDPSLTGIREVVEHIAASRDWVEIVLMTGLVVEPVLGRLAKAELFSRSAPLFGDAATPTVLAQSVAAAERAAATAADLARLVCSDPAHGGSNTEVINGWLRIWEARCFRAAKAFLANFAHAPLEGRAADQVLAAVLSDQKRLVADLGLTDH